MNIEEFREYCLTKKGVTESFPFGDDTLVFKVGNKMFALANLEGELRLNLKNVPEKNIALREQYTSIIPGYHMSKIHWNTVVMDGFLSSKFIKTLIDESYQLIYDSLPKKIKLEIK